MEKDKFLKITNAVYKLIEYFPETEPLRNKIKEKALQIMEGLVVFSLPDNPHPHPQKLESGTEALKDIEILKNYLQLGKLNGWIDNLNLLIVSNEYDKIKEEIKSVMTIIKKAVKEDKQEKNQKNPEELGFSDLTNKEKQKETVIGGLLSERQQKIMEILKIKGRIQVADLKKTMPEVSKRTFRRDLDALLKAGKIKRMGNWNQVFYQLNNIEDNNMIGQNNSDNNRTLLIS